MVQITIDTQKDSPDDIKKAIAYLEGVIGSRSGAEGIPLAAMFSDAVENTPSEEHKSEKKPEQSKGFFNIFSSDDGTPDQKKKDDPDSFIEIVEY